MSEDKDLETDLVTVTLDIEQTPPSIRAFCDLIKEGGVSVEDITGETQADVLQASTPALPLRRVIKLGAWITPTPKVDMSAISQSVFPAVELQQPPAMPSRMDSLDVRAPFANVLGTEEFHSAPTPRVAPVVVEGASPGVSGLDDLTQMPPLVEPLDEEATTKRMNPKIVEV
jgi:hypothetical protein